jgi:predicted MFS family arabinose efflux permease
VLGGAVVALMVGLSLAASQGLVWLALTLGIIPLFLMWRRMPSSQTLIGLLQAAGVRAPHIALLCVATASAFVFFLTPFYLQRTLHLSASATGLTMLSFPLAAAMLGLIGGVVADRWEMRQTAVVGAIVFTVALLMIVPLRHDWSRISVVWRLALLGVGFGLFNGPNIAMAMSHTPRRLLGTTGASISMARQLGFALGPAVATMLWALSGYTLGGMRPPIAFAATLSAVGVLSLARFVK